MRSNALLFSILLGLHPLVAAGWRWEDGVLGLLCFSWMEPWACVKDQVGYFVQETCGNVNDTQLVFLAQFFYDTGNTDESGPLHNLGWLEDCDYCSWENITCNGDNVTSIILEDLGGALTGTIPSEIGYLQELQTLILHSNELTGDIPSEIGLLYNLTTLELHYNSLEGDMPDEVCGLGGPNGRDIFISADCGRPRAEVDCPVRICCDACYIDSLRPTR